MEKQVDILELFLAVKRRLPIALIVTAFSLIIGLIIVFSWPSTYRSSSTILIEQQEIPQDLVRTTVTSFADQRIQMISQRVMTFSKLNEIINQYNVYEEELKKEPLEVVIRQMKRDIKLQMISADVVDPRSGRPIEASIAFTLGFDSKSPKLAQSVANELTSLFLSENIKNRREMAEEAEIFLTGEVHQLEQRSRKLEAQLAEFKEKNLRRLPELTTLNYNLLERTEREYFEIGKQIQTLEERKLLLESQLTQLDPSHGLVGNSETSLLTPTARAKILQNQYINLLATYSDNHPDVVKIKRELEKLVGDGDYPVEKSFIDKQIEIFEAELAGLRSKYGDSHPDVVRLMNKLDEFQLRAGIAELKSNLSGTESGISRLEFVDNPTYVQTATSLESLNLEIASLKALKSELKQKADKLEASLLEGPKVEQQYTELTRDYQNTRAKYQELKAKQLEANLARNLEQERKGERFTLIEPPIIPVEPISPNRTLWAVLTVLFSLGIGGASIFLMENLDQTMHSAQAVQKYLGSPPLATIPHIATSVENSKRRRLQIVTAAVGLILVVSAAVAVHMVYMPLDVLWYVALRKLG